MPAKVYIPRIALIIDGKRYPAGEAIPLTDEQYAQVAAYVDVGTIADEDLAASGYKPDGETPIDDKESDGDADKNAEDDKSKVKADDDESKAKSNSRKSPKK